MRIAVFQSHPIQYFSPLWKELASRPNVSLVVHYFARHGIDASYDADFGQRFAWDIDLLEGYRYEFLPRQWPTTDSLDYRPRALNAGIGEALRGASWDVAYVSGYAYLNNWRIVMTCRRLGIPVLCFGDTNPMIERARPRWRQLAKRVALQPFVRSVGGFLSASGHTERYFQELSAGAVRTFPCPYVVDGERFRSSATPEARERARARYGVPQGKRVVLFCGKLVPWKRPLDVVRALETIERDDVVGLFLGDGELMEAVRSRGGERVVMAGFVNHAELPAALALGDVLVLPSEREPFGLVPAEAGALGVPSIVSDRCGCWGDHSMVQDGVSGLVYPCGDDEALARGIARLLDDGALRARMSEESRHSAARHAPAAVADAFLHAAETVIGVSHPDNRARRASAV